MKIARRALPALAPALLMIVGIAGSPAAQDPPERVGRVSFISGSVSLRPGGLDDWDNAPLNYPLTTGDDLWSDVGGRAEITLGPTTLRLAPSTDFGFLALEDELTQLRLTQGSLQIRVRHLDEDETFEIDTPNGAVSLLVPGTYRVDVNATGNATTVTVRDGEADLIAAGSWFSVDAGETATLAGLDAPYYDVRIPRPPDTWESWGMARDRRRDESPSARWVSPDMPGYEDLDEYGVWSVSAQYGPMWTPRRVTSGWAPYRNGHWAWVDPWGWTWIDDLPWGFAPYHYGRWVHTGRGWAWVPGRVVARPVYAPALVAFVGGSNWSISAGVGGGVGWFPLGPGEAYYPMYRVSDRYLRDINSTTVTVTTLADMANIRYRNRASPGGVTVVTRETFVGGRPVGRSLIVVPRTRLNSAPIVGTAAPFAPNRQSVLRSSGRPVRLPPENNVTRRLVVRRTPPPPPMSFTVRERAMQRNPGRPLDEETLATLRDRNPPPQQQRPVRSATRGGGGPDLRPARQGLAEPRRWSENTDREQRSRGNERNDRDNRGGQRGRDDRRESEQPAAPPRNDRGQRPVDRPADPPLPTPPMLPAEPAPPANPPPPPPRQERGRRPDTGRPQPEPRPPAPPATPAQPPAAAPAAPPPPPPSPPQDRGRRSGTDRPQAEPRPPAAAAGANPMTSVAISGPTWVHANQVCRWTATPSGGTGPYSYSWMSGSVVDNTSSPSTYSVQVLEHFSVTVSVTSADGGQVSASQEITVDEGGPGC